MAVYTHLGADELAALLENYGVGELISAKGIAEGVSNSNWLIETSGRDGNGGRFILTMYERRIEIDDLPFFLGLLDHLAELGCAVPATIHDTDGNAWRQLDGKAVALIEFLPGVSPTSPTPQQAYAVGRALAEIHLAGQSFDQSRPNDLTPEHALAIIESCEAKRISEIDEDLPQFLQLGRQLVWHWPTDLPRSIIHSDLFPDNVLMRGNEVAGIIDFYFAAEDMMAYDLAVTHAAWCFDKVGESYSSELGSALISGYESIRPLEDKERSALPVLAQGACLRFVATRAEDWLETENEAHVERKDPMEFARRWEFYLNSGDRAFA